MQKNKAGISDRFFADFSKAEIEAIILKTGQKKFRLKQIADNFFQQFKADYAEMTDLPADFREIMQFKLRLNPLTLVNTENDENSGTTKYVFKLLDGNIIETVLMRIQTRRTVCVSSQVGCPIRCNFCASGKDGYIRNLTASEIFAQVHFAQRTLKDENILPLSNIVFMGIGEPLLNYDSVVSALGLLTDQDWGLGISPRRITVSTAGIITKFEDLASDSNGVKLAISMHAADDEVRKILMPNVRFSLNEIINAGHMYFIKTRRIVSLEYLLIKDLNNSEKDAQVLSNLIKPFNFKVNLIPYNEVEGYDFKRPRNFEIQDFHRILTENGINVKIRKSLGGKITAACGQLRGTYPKQ